MPTPPITPLADYDVDVVITNTINNVVPGGSQIYYNVLDYGVDPTGINDNTAAYNAIFALASSGVMFFPPGTYVGQVNFPDTAVDRTTNWHLLGSGVSSTFLRPPLANTTVLWRAERVVDGIIEGSSIGGFTVEAHAAGSTGTAIDLAGFRSCLIHDIGYKSNAGGDFNSLIHLSSGSFRCYGNVMRHIVIDGGTVGNTGPNTVILFDNKDVAGVPQGLGANANDHLIDECFIYSNTGIATAIDCLRSAGVRIQNSFFESNAGCTYVIPGSGCHITNNHFESGVVVDNILYNNIPGQGAGNDTVVDNNEFSDLATLTFHGGVTGNLWFNNLNQNLATFIENGANNIVRQGGTVLFGNEVTLHAGSTGTAPSVSATNLGAGGTASLFAGSNDTDGIIVLVFGAAVALDGVVTVTFATPYVQFPSVMICPATGPVAGWTIHTSKPLQLSAISNTAFDVVWANGTVPNPGDEFHINYHVKGLPD